MDHHDRVTAYVALGANLGDRAKNLRDALEMLDAPPSVRVVAVSSLMENPAVGGPADSPPFLNAAAQVSTTVAASALLAHLLGIEQALGRRRQEKWGPRTIDLDLLLYGNEVMAGEDLVIPHPRMCERRFVLQPLAEIAPSLVVPGVNRTVSELLRAL